MSYITIPFRTTEIIPDIAKRILFYILLHSALIIDKNSTQMS